MEKYKSFIQNKRVLVTGGAGSIGSALCRKLSQLNPELLVILDQDETGVFDVYEELKNKCNLEYSICSVRDAQTLFDIFGKYKPQIVYHAAAYKHVALMEKFPQEALKTNVHGTASVIRAAKYGGAEKFVFISSDKAVNPSCVMGATKLEGEKMCLAEKSDTKFIVVRFGNVMPSRGSVVPIYQKAIAEERPLVVTDERMKRYFMGIYDAVDLVLQATYIGEGGEKIILDMGEQIYIKDLAKMMIKLSGKDLGITYTAPQKGEKYEEELMTEAESKLAVKQGNLWIIK